MNHVPTYRVSWQGGHESGLDEAKSERLAQTLAREFGMVVTRAPEERFDPTTARPVPDDEELVEQVREAVAEGLARPVRNPEGRGNAA